MKKALFVLLMVVSLAMLLAVESAPSAVVGYVKYDAVVGLNLVAMPMNDGATMTSEAVAAYGDNIDTINIWDPVAQNWSSATNYGGGFWDPELPVGPGSILYFNALAPFTYYSIGSLPATNASYDIVAGLNTIMVPLNHADYTLTSVAGATMNDLVDTINLWDPVAQNWSAATNYGGGFWDPDLTIAIGTPMYVNSAGSITWPGARSASAPVRNASVKITTSSSRSHK